MIESDWEAILDECLHDTSTRDGSVERCLQRYPQHAGQLAPLVQVADHIRKASHPMLSASTAKAIEQRLLKRATDLERSGTQPSLWSLPFSLRPLVNVAATLIVVLALVLAGGGGIVYASTDSLPGSPLYSVKRAIEQVQLFLTPASTKRTELHIKFAQKRLEEVQALAEIKDQVDEEALSAIAEETELALEEVKKAPAQDKTALLDKLVSLTERQQAVLEGVQAGAPEAAQKGLNRALEASRQGHGRAREALEKEKPGGRVEPTPSPIPSKTRKPTHTPKATPTPKATHAPQPTKTTGPTQGPGEQGQGQGPPSTPAGQGHGPPATPLGQSDEEHGPPAESPGQSDKDHSPSGQGKDKKKEGGGPLDESPGKEKDKGEGGGPPDEPPGKEKDKGESGGGDHGGSGGSHRGGSGGRGKDK